MFSLGFDLAFKNIDFFFFPPKTNLKKGGQSSEGKNTHCFMHWAREIPYHDLTLLGCPLALTFELVCSDTASASSSTPFHKPQSSLWNQPPLVKTGPDPCRIPRTGPSPSSGSESAGKSVVRGGARTAPLFFEAVLHATYLKPV